jgi:hypothetical protein
MPKLAGNAFPVRERHTWQARSLRTVANKVFGIDTALTQINVPIAIQ